MTAKLSSRRPSAMAFALACCVLSNEHPAFAQKKFLIFGDKNVKYKAFKDPSGRFELEYPAKDWSPLPTGGSRRRDPRAQRRNRNRRDRSLASDRAAGAVRSRHQCADRDRDPQGTAAEGEGIHVGDSRGQGRPRLADSLCQGRERTGPNGSCTTRSAWATISIRLDAVVPGGIAGEARADHHAHDRRRSRRQPIPPAPRIDASRSSALRGSEHATGRSRQAVSCSLDEAYEHTATDAPLAGRSDAQRSHRRWTLVPLFASLSHRA